ncbi:MAG: right-handed parallel beta-helix repeat-containing protein [Candidatus Eisenbacteria sp.]|nr:right-handed parallel beta-helix repeat-containing protein [Candidatus Eisenbacteria bacterium]
MVNCIEQIFLIRPDGLGDYATIQDAIDIAYDGDTVLLADGTFTGEGNRGIDFLGKAITVRSESGDPSLCIIDCDASPGDHSSGVRMTSGEAASSVLEGVTITNSYTADGGALVVTNFSHPTISNCIITGNHSEGRGGGIYCYASLATFTNCVVASNSAGTMGGGMYCGFSLDPTLTNCTFVDNSAPTGGGIYATNDCDPDISHTIIAFGTQGEAIACDSGNPSLACCDVYGNAGGDWVGCIAGQGSANNNFSEDPLFCDPSGGDFRLPPGSPCLEGSCGQVGALGIGCLAETPMITGIEDVGNDQGGQVRLSWTRSRHDDSGDPIISGYEIYRREDNYSRDRAEGSMLDTTDDGYLLRARMEGWDYVIAVPAHGDSIYQGVVPTLCDSTIASGVCWSVFLIRATTPDPFEYFDSPPDSGYSVDNLAPAAPGGLDLDGYQLTWNEAPEEDFDYFTVYGSSVETLDETAMVVDWTTTTEIDVQSNPWPYYHVTVTDFAGNEGVAASVANSMAAPDPGVRPSSYALSRSWPNPFRASTTIRFDLPEASLVRLKVLDVNGRLVDVLLDTALPTGRYSVLWSGDDSKGLRVSPGIYFCRLEAGEFRQTRMVIAVH